MSDVELIIVGGGLAGLACSKFAQQAGISTALVERASEVGGLLRQVVLGGREYDLGPHYFFHGPEFAWVRSFVETFGPTTTVRPFAVTLPDGLWGTREPYPVLRSCTAPSSDGAQQGSDSRTLEDALLEMVGPEAYARYYKHYSIKYWGIDPSGLGCDFVKAKIRLADHHEPFFGEEASYRPQAGFGRLVEQLTPEVVITGEAVSLQANKDSVMLGLKDGRSLSARAAIVTVPPTLFLRTTSIRARGLLLYYTAVILRGTSLFDQECVHWAYMPSSKYSFTRVTHMDRACLHHDRGYAVLCFEIPCSDPQRRMDREIESVRQFLKDNGVSEFASIDSVVLGISGHSPVPCSGNLAVEAQLQQFLQRNRNIRVAGRLGRCKFIWMRDVLADARLAVSGLEKTL